MTSTNSLNNNRFLPMFKNVFKRNIAFFLVVQILSAIYAFVITRLNLRSIAEMAEYMEAGYKEDLTTSSLWSMSFFLYVAGSIWMFILAVALFREIYSRRASAFYYAMPVNRGVYFNVNLLYGVLTVLTAFVLIAGISATVIKTNNICAPEFYTFDALHLIKVLIVALLSVIVNYAIFMMCAVLSGRVWHYLVLSYAAINFVYGMVINLIRYINDSIWGILLLYDRSWVISPSTAFMESLEAEKVLKYIVVLAIQFTLTYFTGYMIFKKRKAEVAETSLAGKIVPTIAMVICLLSVSSTCVAIVDLPILARVGIAVAATAVVSIIVTALFHKKAFTKRSLKCLIGVVVAMLIFVAAVEILPNIKYKNYVPAPSEVESVVFEENVASIEGDSYFSHFLNTVLFSFEGNYFYGSDYPTFNFSSEESKERIEELHKKLIEQSTIDNQYSDDYYYHGEYSVKLTYNLKNGSTVSRYYDVCSKDIYDEYIALMQTEEALRQTEPLNFKEEDVQFISVMDHNSEIYEWFDDEDMEYSDPYDYAAYDRLDEYTTLFDNVIKDKANESRDVFYTLRQTTAFLVYDIDNYYRAEEEEDFDIEGLLNGEYYDYDYDYEPQEDYYPDYHDVTIIVYTYNQYVTEEMKELFSEMTPLEIRAYEQEYMLTNEGFLLEESMIYLNNEEDTNTISYLKSLGLL